MVTNLTNTTWKFDEYLKSSYRTGFSYDVTFDVSIKYGQTTAVVKNNSTFQLRAYNNNYFFPNGNYTVYDTEGNFIKTISNGGFYYGYETAPRINSTFRTDFEGYYITFTGGTDVTNPQLISWLEANGTLQGGETPTPKLYIGNKAVTSMSIGNKAILKMYVGNSLIYEKASGEESVSITLVAEYGGANEQASVFVKFGTPPTDTNDYDYNALDGERYLIDRDRVNVGNNLQIDVSTKAYIWLLMPDTKAGYKLNNGSLVNVGTGYANATEVTLSNGDTLSLVSTLLD